MSTQQFMQEAQFLHTAFVTAATMGVGLILLIVVEYLRRK